MANNLAVKSNSTFSAIRARRSVRRFSADPIPDALLLELMSLANRAPSGFNLQPWHFIVVKDPHVKELLYHVALNQQQVLDAPVTVVFVADPKFWTTHYKSLLQKALDSQLITKERASKYSRSVRLLFQTGPFGVFGFLKRAFAPILRLLTPIPNLVTSSHEAAHYVHSQTMFAVGTFLIAAKAAGVDTCPMEGFDELRLKKLLNIPSYMKVSAIVPTGYPATTDVPEIETIRSDIGDKVSVDSFTNKLGQVS